VNHTLAEPPAAAPGTRPTSAENSPDQTAGSVPTTQLRGCVQHFTGDTQPQLVDRATYQGTPAYVIASTSRVWVVGLGCTATKPELITSVPLAG
jgi:hypothetical protein